MGKNVTEIISVYCENKCYIENSQAEPIFCFHNVLPPAPSCAASQTYVKTTLFCSYEIIQATKKNQHAKNESAGELLHFKSEIPTFSVVIVNLVFVQFAISCLSKWIELLIDGIKWDKYAHSY